MKIKEIFLPNIFNQLIRLSIQVLVGINGVLKQMWTHFWEEVAEEVVMICTTNLKSSNQIQKKLIKSVNKFQIDNFCQSIKRKAT